MSSYALGRRKMVSGCSVLIFSDAAKVGQAVQLGSKELSGKEGADQHRKSNEVPSQSQ
jgi:hypothetical protein